MKTPLLAAALCAAAVAAEAETLKLPVYGECEVVDTVDCSQTDHRFADYPAGASRVETILGKPCRVLDVQPETASWVDWRLGEGKDLRPNAAYVVVIEYPDDEPRAFHVRNYGNNSRRSFYTGRSNGDAFEGPIVHHKPESLNLPQSGKYEKWTSLTFLGLKAANRRDLDKNLAEKTGEKHQLDIATDGFEIARADLNLRGPGDFFGTRQHGLPAFKVGSLVNDMTTLQDAQAEAAAFLSSEELPARPEYAPLMERIRALFAEDSTPN